MFERTKLKGVTHRSLVKIESSLAGRSELEQRIGMMQGSMASIAMGHACYPSASYGDERDDLLNVIKQSEYQPIEARLSSKCVESWLDRDELSMPEAFEKIWGVDYMAFLNAVFNRQ